MLFLLVLKLVLWHSTKWLTYLHTYSIDHTYSIGQSALIFFFQQSFSEPLRFNKNTGGFEVVTKAKKELSEQLKAAILSQKSTPKIYRVVKKHSFMPIPLIPIEDEVENPLNQEINTAYTVTVSWEIWCHKRILHVLDKPTNNIVLWVRVHLYETNLKKQGRGSDFNKFSIFFILQYMYNVL